MLYSGGSAGFHGLRMHAESGAAFNSTRNMSLTIPPGTLPVTDRINLIDDLLT